jgi:hypothetical protein
MALRVQLMTLEGGFNVASTVVCETMDQAMDAVQMHIAAQGFTNLKRVDDMDSIRFTARTPGGRNGRNVAFADFEFNDDEF